MVSLLLFAQLATATQAGTPAVASLVERARSARYQQDSTLGGYHAVAKQRMSSGIGLARGLGLGAIGRERLAARFESVARVGWDRSLGAWGELIGARSVVPIVGMVNPEPEDDDVALILPYHPGRDRLWPMTEIRDAMPGVREWIEHPLDPGADSLYAFQLGDSINMRLGDGTLVRLRELRVRPRRPDSRLIVGSLWVDVATGALVRAAYRPSVAIDLWPFMEREIGRNDRDMVKKFGPFNGIIEEVIVEHGLYEGRFWLPRVRTVTGEGTARGGRITLSIQQSFSYDKVYALPAGVVYVPQVDTGGGIDPRTGRVRRPTWRNVENRGSVCRPTGDTNTVRYSPDSLLRNSRLSVMTAEGVRFRVLEPCDDSTLLHSPTLPGSIYSSSDELFTEVDFKKLHADAAGALGLSQQASWNPQPTTVHFGLERGMLRYNRIEGLSAGALLDRELGNGYTTTMSGRIGTADRQPNVDLSLSRSNARDDLRVAGYRRLVAANDWGDPFAPGASLSAFLFGRDDGFYFRTFGAELAGRRSASAGTAFTWRLFAERHDSARVRTHVSLANAVGDAPFDPNIGAREGMFVGGVASAGFNWGTDPRGTRVSTITRLEGAAGEAGYGRAALELSIARGLLRGLEGTMTGAAGSTVGDAPVQRLWHLGGAYTVRGHRAGAAVGESFWFARGELAKGHPMFRPIVFADIGWAGARDDFARSPDRIFGAGAGVATLDGLLRLDVARGWTTASDSKRQWRVDFYFNPR